ncbi:unnamed protein product [Paramecium sonneborni]|uniref:MORN repeat protein n=1 Tax=Paramecium sonneborni TaxID=65129 RepID=A0A8S1QC40_9CILI|nr:unnamed protein product [Paramecium sonneborni]CAD8113024.1 unnamed protein product [Paramecium sonneborni]
MYKPSFIPSSTQPKYISYVRYIQPPLQSIIKTQTSQLHYSPIPTTIVYHIQPIIPVRHSNSIYQSYQTRIVNPLTQQMVLNTSYQHQPYVRQSIPIQAQQQLYTQSFHQQSSVNQPRQSKQAQSMSTYQAAPSYQHNQQYSQPPILQQQEDDLEKKFQDAIDRTRDLVHKYNKPQQKNEEEQQQELQELALQYEDGYIYRGQGYEPATREGFGVLTDQNENEVYSGYWQDNQYHGQGKLINYSAQEIQGPFDYRDLSIIENGWLSYEGDFFQGKMQGNGTLYLTNGERYQGLFYDGMIEGKGVFISQTGQEIEGLWREGVLEN